MSEVYDRWPQIANDSFSTNFSKIDIKNIDHVVFAGMGGSGTIGDVFSSILSETDMHVSVVKGYLLPKTVDNNTLVVTTSISGNTLETISVLKNAEKVNAEFVALSSGGIMEKFCADKEIKHYKIRQEHSPRASFVGFLYSALNILEQIIPVKKANIIQSIESLSTVQKSISLANLDKTNEALQIAEWIKEIPLVYVKTKERWKIVKEVFHEKNISYKEIFSQEGTILNKLVCLIYVLDYASIYNAVISKTDPTPIKSIDFIKERL